LCRDSQEEYGPQTKQKSLRVRLKVFPAEASPLQTQIQASHHRALDAGAVLGVVNALRFASTRPSAGPADIDDASARHVRSNYAMVGNLSITRRDHSKRVDAGIAQAYVGIITSVPHGTPSLRRHGLRSAHSAGAQGHGIERNPQKSQSDARRPTLVRRRRSSCEPRCLSPRVILRITRCAEDAFTRGVASPWL
jgi:hypothetical protein